MLMEKSTGVEAGLFTEYAARKLEDHWAQIRRCVGLMSEEQLWHRANSHSNSVANLLLHLRGNVGQWILGGIGGKEIERERQAEFDARGGVTREELIDGLDGVLAAACGVIRGMDADRLAWEFMIQSYRVSGIAAVMHVVEHFAFHTGQIVTTTKWLLDVDLSLYDERGQRRDGRRDEVP
jgi:uncharacterized damage-inducible protein DinB